MNNSFLKDLDLDSRAQQSLEKKIDRLRTIFVDRRESFEDAYSLFAYPSAVVDDYGRLKFFNEEFSELRQFAPLLEDAIASSASKFRDSEDRESGSVRELFLFDPHERSFGDVAYTHLGGEHVLVVFTKLLDIASIAKEIDLFETSEQLSNVGSWSFDRQTKRMFWSKQMFRIFDLHPRESKPSLTLLARKLHPDDVEIVKQTFKKLRYDTVDGNVDFRILTENGVVRHMTLTLCVQSDTKIHGSVQDVSRIRRILDENVYNQKRFSDILDTAGEYIFEVDVEGRYTFASSRIESLLGYRLSELLGRPFFDFMDEVESARMKGLFESAAESEASIDNVEYSSVSKGGKVVWHAINARPIFLKDGSFVGYRGAGLNVSAYKETELALKESEERYELATEGSNSGIWDWNILADEIYWSNRLVQSLRLGSVAFKTSLDYLRDRVHSNDLIGFDNAIGLHVEFRKACNIECRLRCGDGEYLWFN